MRGAPSFPLRPRGPRTGHFSGQADGPDGVFYGVAAELEAATVEEAGKPLPVRESP